MVICIYIYTYTYTYIYICTSFNKTSFTDDIHICQPFINLPTRCFWWPRKCLGRPGLMAIGSAHAFIWPQPANISRAVGRPRLRVEFQKHKAEPWTTVISMRDSEAL